MKSSLFLFYFLVLIYQAPRKGSAVINTVHGEIPIDSMGLTLIHEHMLVDFIGVDSVSQDRYDRELVVEKVLPYLLEVKEFGVKTIFDCTPSYLAKDPILLKELSEKSGIQIVTNTGFYGAVGGKYLPDFFQEENESELAARWISEFEKGIEETGIKPGFIKISVNEEEPLKGVDAKMVKASGIAHQQTGLQIVSHTGTWKTAQQEVEILEDMGISPSAFVWVHAQAEQDFQNYQIAAAKGVWISLDGIGWGIEDYVERLEYAKERGILDRILISHDAGWYDPGKPDGGNFQPFTGIFKKLMPALNEKGWTKKDWNLLLMENPKKAFGMKAQSLE